jgi:hypothetical protein
MNYLAIALIFLGFTALHSHAQTQCKNSVLGNINCGGGQATCFQAKIGTGGAVRCTCTATCLSPSSILPSVSATRAVSWGDYIPGGKACATALYGKAQGGTESNTNSTTATAVFAFTSLEGQFINGPYASSIQSMDCFLGLVDNTPPIVGLC